MLRFLTRCCRLLRRGERHARCIQDPEQPTEDKTVKTQPFVTDRVRVERRVLEDVRRWAERYETTLTIALSLLIRRGLREEEAARANGLAEGRRQEREAASAEARAKSLPLRQPVDEPAQARRIPTPIPAPVVEGTANGHLSELATAVELLSSAVESLKKSNAESGMRTKVTEKTG